MDSEMMRQIYVPKWELLNESALDDSDMCRSMVNHLAPLVFFSQLRGMDYNHLFTEFNVGAARQTCLGAEVRMRLEHTLREKKRLE
nr:transposase (putative), gypsy type [Tanacetum cinerariifolium]